MPTDSLRLRGTFRWRTDSEECTAQWVGSVAEGQGGGQGWHDTMTPAAGGAYWSLATYCCPSLKPLPSVGGGAHRPLTTFCPPSPRRAYPYLPTPPSFPFGRLCQRSSWTFPVSLLRGGSMQRRATALSPLLSPPCVLPLPTVPSLLPFPFLWSVVPTEPPDFACFTALCRVHTEEGNIPRRWPGASKRSSQTGGEGPLPNGSLWALGCPLAGSLPRRGHITTFCPSDPTLSLPCGEGIMYPLPPLYVHGVCFGSPLDSGHGAVTTGDHSSEGQPLRTALRDRQPPTANRQPPPTANRQPPTATNPPYMPDVTGPD